MQRYRVNYRVLGTLAVGGVAAIGALYGIWKFQVSRNADKLLERARRAEESLDFADALGNLTQYVRLTRGDAAKNDAAWLALGRTALAAIESKSEVDQEDKILAYRALYEAAPRSKDVGLLRKLVELQLYGGAPLDALENVRKLLPTEWTSTNVAPAERLAACRSWAASDPDRAELLVLEANCLFVADRPKEGEQRCYELIGYSPEDGTLDAERAITPGNPQAYSMLAAQLIAGDREPQLVDKLIERLAEQSASQLKAGLEQHRLLLMLKRREDAEAVLAKASELAPDDADVLYRLGLQAQDGYTRAVEEKNDERPSSVGDLAALESEVVELLRKDLAGRSDAAALAPLREALAAESPLEPALRKSGLSKMADGSLRSALEPLAAYYDAVANQDEPLARRRLDEARRQLTAAISLEAALGYFSRGMQQHAENVGFYERTSLVQRARGDLPAALETLDKALQRFGTPGMASPAQIRLTQLKIDVLFAMSDFTAVEAEIAAMRKLESAEMQALADFHEARLDAAREKWFDAARKLRDVRIRLSAFPEQQALAAVIEGFCQERLARFDLAREAYEDALKVRDLPQARSGLERAAAQMGVESGAAPDQASKFDELVVQELDKPLSQQNWEPIYAAIDKMVDQNNLPETRALLYRAQVTVQRAQRAAAPEAQRDLFDEAREIITRAYRLDKTDRTVIPAAIRLLALEPGTGPARALEYYERVLPDFGDDPSMRRLLADLLVARGSDQLAAELKGVADGMESWSAKDQAAVWQTLASNFNRLNMPVDARDGLVKALELDPDSLPTAMLLFDVAVKLQDDPAVALAQQYIRKSAGGERSPEYILTEVKRRLVGLSRGTVSREDANAGRAMLDLAIEERPTWHELYVLRGQFAALMDRDSVAALENFSKALEYGRANVNALILQIQLLADLGRYAEAVQALDRVPAEMRASLLRERGPEVLLQSGRREEAAQLAKQVAAADANNEATQVWYAQMAQRLDDPAAAEGALRRALEINSTDPAIWSRLVGLCIQTRQEEKLLQVLREAHLALDEEFVPPLTAKYYELYGRWDAAEDIYLSLYADRLQDSFSARRLAEFYRNWATRGGKTPAAAAPYVNSLLKAVDAGTLGADHSDAVWARQQAAEMLAATGDYQDSLKAEKLLSTRSGSEQAQAVDQAMLASLLARREDPESHLRAVELYRQIPSERGGLSSDQGIELGKLLYQTGDWRQCRSQMEFAISQHPEDIDLRSSYIAMLVEQREFEDAERWVERLRNIEGAQGIALEYSVRIAARRGDLDAVRRLLKTIVPRLGPEPTEQQLGQVLQAARLAVSVRDFPTAVDYYAQFAERSDANALEVASVIAQYGDLDQGLAQLQKFFPQQMDDVLRLAVAVYRQRRSEAPEKLDALLDQMTAAALRDDPESAARLELRAESREVAEKYEEAVVAYDKLLQRDDVPKPLRATALNNLAYLLALTGKTERFPDALRAVEEAAEILGPLSDILDTRAVVRMAMGDPQQAVQDMQMAVRVGATPSKYFHYAKAQWLAGKQQEAAATWKKGVQEGLDAAAIPPLEQASYQEIAAGVAPLLGS